MRKAADLHGPRARQDPRVGGASGTAGRIMTVEVVGPVRHGRRSREVVILFGLVEDEVVTRGPR